MTLIFDWTFASQTGRNKQCRLVEKIDSRKSLGRVRKKLLRKYPKPVRVEHVEWLSESALVTQPKSKSKSSKSKSSKSAGRLSISISAKFIIFLFLDYKL